jgi:hypothetical protein
MIIDENKSIKNLKLLSDRRFLKRQDININNSNNNSNNTTNTNNTNNNNKNKYVNNQNIRLINNNLYLTIILFIYLLDNLFM